MTLSLEPESPSKQSEVGPAAGEAARTAQPADGSAGGGPLLPLTNRGVTERKTGDSVIQVGLHYLTLTVFVQASLLVIALLKVLFNITLDETEAYEEGKWRNHFPEMPGTGRHFNSLCLGPFGMKLYRLPRSGATYCSIEFPGECVESVGEDRLIALLQYLNASPWRWHATRVDVAFDGCPFTPVMCRDAWKAGNVRTEAQSESYKLLESPEGDTFYIGSRSSARYIRVYDRRGPTRLEIEFKKPYADAFCRNLLTFDDATWHPFAFECIREFLDFVDASSAKTLKECAPLPWWQEFVGDAGKASTTYARPKPQSDLISSNRQYLERMLPSICVAKIGLGVSIDILCDGFEGRLTEKHKRKIQALREALGFGSWTP